MKKGLERVKVLLSLCVVKDRDRCVIFEHSRQKAEADPLRFRHHLSVVVLLLGCLFVSTPSYSGVLKWSYSGKDPAKVQVIATYPDGSTIEWFKGTYDPGPDPENRRRIRGFYGENENRQQAKQIELKITRPIPPDDPQLSAAVIMGTPGNLFQADISEALISLIGLNEYLVPMLSNETVELFAAVDLAQWLSSPPVFDIDDVFTITAGVSPLLPGYIVGTSPITFSSSTGWVTTDPFTGPASVIGIVDGSAVPEPSSIWLMGSSLLGVLVLCGMRKAVLKT